MKTTSVFLSTFFLLMNLHLNAQLDRFNLSDYKMPDVENHLLDLNFSIDHSNASNTNFNSTQGTTDVSVLIGELDANYYGFKNSIDWQKELSIQSSLYNLIADDSNPSNNRSSSNQLLRTNNRILLVNRRYFDKKIFFEFDQDFTIQYNRNKIKNQISGNTSDQKTSSRTIMGYMPVKFGFGRIENVGDARHALFIIDALRKKGIVNRDLSSAEIIDFATLISELKNTRFFDSRIQKIKELKTLDTFLKTKDYISQREIEYFTTLNDIWIFGDNRNRRSGNRFSFVVNPGVTFTKSKGSGFFINYTALAYDLNGGLEYINEKPINQKWQNTFSSYLFLGIVKGRFGSEEVIDTKINIPKFNTGFINTIAYYPNTRTTIQYSLNANYDSFLNRIDENLNQTGIDGERFKLTSDLNIEYFISPRFSINISSQADFINFYTSKNQEFIDTSILSLVGYPNCEDFSCNDYLRQKKIQQLRFKIAFDYNLF